MMDNQVEEHAFGSYIPKNAEIIFIGTFPTHKRNRSFEFFYPNKTNIFWKILNDIFNLGHNYKYFKDEDAVIERKAFLSANKIAVTDMLAKAKREKDNSKDEQLAVIELMDIISILDSCTTIDRVILTSRSGKISALNLFKVYLESKGILISLEKNKYVIKGKFQYNQRVIKIYVPYSPSLRAANRLGFQLIKDMYMECLIK